MKKATYTVSLIKLTVAQKISLRFKENNMYYCVHKKPAFLSYSEPAEFTPLPPRPFMYDNFYIMFLPTPKRVFSLHAFQIILNEYLHLLMRNTRLFYFFRNFISLKILSWFRGSVTNNNGFWI
jgi:hypothetical protein